MCMCSSTHHFEPEENKKIVLSGIIFAYITIYFLRQGRHKRDGQFSCRKSFPFYPTHLTTITTSTVCPKHEIVNLEL